MNIMWFAFLVFFVVVGGSVWFGVNYYFAPKWAFEKLCRASENEEKAIINQYLDFGQLSNTMETAIEEYVEVERVHQETVPLAVYNQPESYERVVAFNPTQVQETRPKAMFSQSEIDEMVRKLVDRTFVNVEETNKHISVDTRDQAANIKAEIALPGKNRYFTAEFRMLKENKAWRLTEWKNIDVYLKLLIEQDLLRTVLR